MAERIEIPPTLQGDEKKQLQQLWSYLYQLSESLNNNLEGIGSNELTDSERQTMQAIVGKGEAQGMGEMETLKSLIIKTADFVQTSLTEYRLNLLGSTVASGQFGRYVRNTGLNVAVTPEGVTQNYTFEEVVQGLKEFSVNAKNYIKTGLLRTVGVLPVYGVAIGKDVVTFSEDGTETYNDGNKVAELTAEELSFWQNGEKIASYTGNKIAFLFGGAEVFYLQAGKIYCAQDLEIASGKKLIITTQNFSIDAGGNVTINGGGTFSGNLSAAGGTFAGNLSAAGGTFAGDLSAAGGTFAGDLSAAGGTFAGNLSAAGGTFAGTMSAACITSGTMSADRISGGTIDARNVAVTNLDAGNITSGTMSANKISGGTIDASNVTINNLDAGKITTGTMSANKISGGSIDASNVTINNLDASKITTGTMSANKISGGSIDASNVTINNLDASKITSGTMSASKINGGTLNMGGNNNTHGVINIIDAAGNVVGVIDKDGIRYSGAMSLTSGGSLYVQATDFVLDSLNKSLQIGEWTLDEDGLRDNSYTQGDVNFELVKEGNATAGNAGILFYQENSSTAKMAGIKEKFVMDESGTISTGTLKKEMFNDVATGKGLRISTDLPQFHIGTVNNPAWLHGEVVAQSAIGISNLNNVTASGHYHLNGAYTNAPPNFSEGMMYVMDESTWTQQTIYTDSAIYIRRKRWGTWGGWYKFTGTAV